MILLGTADVGPAKYIVELYRLDELDNGLFEYVGGELTTPLFSKNALKLNDNWKESSPKLIVSGTSLGDSLDKKLIIWAKKNNIPSISLIEHWSWYRKRFELNGELILPDYIFVNDQIACDDAITDGLPAEKLVIAGNPVLEELRNRSNKELNRDKLLVQYNLPTHKRVIVFISEELASEFNNTDSDLGYDEFTVLKKIIEHLEPSDYLVIKSHPVESLDKYNSFVNNQIKTIQNMDIHELNCIADYVVGMASMLLLELAMLRNDVISFRPNATKSFIGNRLKATVDITSEKKFTQTVLQREELTADGSFRNHFQGSTARIVSLIKELAQLKS